LKTEPAPPAPGASPGPDVPRYRPLSKRRRWLVAGLALAASLVVLVQLLFPPTAVRRLPAPCSAGQDTGCVGGKADVIVIPPASSASR